MYSELRWVGADAGDAVGPEVTYEIALRRILHKYCRDAKLLVLTQSMSFSNMTYEQNCQIAMRYEGFRL